MQNTKKWNIKGPAKWNTLINPLRNYIERRVPGINKEAESIADRPKKCVNVSIGDPARYKNFKLNPTLIDFLLEAVGKFDGYTEFRGGLECRKAIAAFYNSTEPTQITPDDIFMTNGGSMALWLSIATLCNPGDNFLFPEAGFPLADTIAKSLGVKTRFYKLDRNNDWKVDFKGLEDQIDANTRFMLVNDPSNPLGSVWPEDHKKEIVQFCRKHKLVLVTDEIYQTMTFSPQPKRFVQLRGDVVVLKCAGLTKKWLVPGWRVGWLVVYGGEETKLIREGIKNLLDVLLMPHSLIQGAMPQIMADPTHSEYLSGKMSLLQKNQQYLSKQLSTEDYCIVSKSSGALYSTISIKIERFEFPNTVEWSLAFLKQQNVLLFPGEFFFSNNFIRLVMCCDFEDMVEFCTRFKAFSHKHIKKE